MNQRRTQTLNTSATGRTNRRGLRPLRLRRFLVWVLLGLLSQAPALAQTDGPAISPQTARTLYLSEVQLTGATRTPLATVYRHLDLVPGQPIDQTQLVDAVDRLRSRGLFKSVEFYTRPGEQRGHLILVLEVEEQGLDFRWAAGNTDLDGWYLVPAMLAYDNALGKGRLLDLQWRVGFRHTALLLRYAQPTAGDGRDYWGTQVHFKSTDRPYFSDGAEYRHVVGTGGGSGVFGRRFGDHNLAEIGLIIESVDVAEVSTTHTSNGEGSYGEEVVVPTEDLPDPIRDVVGRDGRAILTLDWQHDTRAKLKRAGSPVSGIWGRVKGRFVAQDKYSHVGLQADLRAFKEAPGGVLAARMRGAWVGESAAFYDRLYLGGMYSVRGFPTHSLSAPGGDTWLWSGSLEYRSRILGDNKGTKLAGLFFLDAGASGASDADDPYVGVASSAGYGLRMRVWWLDWIGVDVGFPLTARPVDMRFQVNASIGWSF